MWCGSRTFTPATLVVLAVPVAVAVSGARSRSRRLGVPFPFAVPVPVPPFPFPLPLPGGSCGAGSVTVSVVASASSPWAFPFPLPVAVAVPWLPGCPATVVSVSASSSALRLPQSERAASDTTSPRLAASGGSVAWAVSETVAPWLPSAHSTDVGVAVVSDGSASSSALCLPQSERAAWDTTSPRLAASGGSVAWATSETVAPWLPSAHSISASGSTVGEASEVSWASADVASSDGWRSGLGRFGRRVVGRRVVAGHHAAVVALLLGVGRDQGTCPVGSGGEDPGAGGRKTADPQTGNCDDGDGDATARPPPGLGRCRSEHLEHRRECGLLADLLRGKGRGSKGRDQRIRGVIFAGHDVDIVSSRGFRYSCSLGQSRESAMDEHPDGALAAPHDLARPRTRSDRRPP